MTKTHEEVIRDTAQNVYEDFSSRQSVKGEFAICICPKGVSVGADREE